MILYSIIPVEYVFRDLSNKSEEAEYFETEYMGEKLQVARQGNDSYRIVRIISTSPKAFLNPMLQPGSILNGITVK